MTTGLARQGPAAVQLRVSGASFQDIADTLGLSSAKAAIRLVTTELASHEEENRDARERLRAETNMALDQALQSVSGKALDPQCDEHLTALRTMMTILDRRAKLNGLDAPTELVVHNPTETEIDQWVAMQVESAMPGVEEADADELLGIVEGEVISDSEDASVEAT